MSAADARLDELWRARPRSRFLRWSFGVFFTALASSWFLHRFDWAGLISARRLRNLRGFLDDVRPAPLRHGEEGLAAVFDWVVDRLTVGGGLEAAVATVAISLVAMAIAGGAGYLLSLFAARNLAAAEAFVPNGRPPSPLHRLYWRGVVVAARVLCVLLRSLPEYVIAFLAVAVMAGTPWPGILALAIHNSGILGRLNAESIENLPPRALQALRSLGATRRQLAFAGVFPLVLPRFLLYWFYRWETCVREATVLGTLGFASLGFLVSEARVRQRHDELVLVILLGSAIVLAGDLISSLARRLVREA